MALHGYLLRPKVDFSLANAQAGSIIYKLFQNAHEPGCIIREEYISEVDFGNATTIIFLHGWGTKGIPFWYELLKNEYFKLGACNVIYVDWSKASNKSFDRACANVKPLGKFIAEFLSTSEIPTSNIHIVAHSLGSHLAGFIGKFTFSLTGKKIARITALDPGGPKFNNPEMTSDDRLCAGDAGFVDVIHTDINFAGYTEPIGHVDFYPNGGQDQPGCPSREEDGSCSHDRSILYFIESLKTKVKAQEATFIKNKSLVELIENGAEVIFGQHIDLNTRGVYFFQTNASEPFLCCH